MAGAIKRLNWVKTLSHWEQSQAWQRKRRAMISDFSKTNLALRNGLATAAANQIAGAGDLAARAASDRIRAAYLARLNKVA